ncbi:MAG: imidazole glycerol phosphate synthase subunit HisH [Candidatus Cloacimonetes bacterium]|nr:imidazole glycerol phosphate synthase subunit HisH [Candidatus Cloacimonadota bacterium]
MKNVLIIDYNVGNIKSVQRALEHIGANVTISSNPKEIERASKVILPGVGAFNSAMKEIDKLKLRKSILKFVATKQPILGICLGMQMLLDSSEEFCEEDPQPGLSIISGYSTKIPIKKIDQNQLKLPHIGWSKLHIENQRTKLFKDITDKDSFYFVHSYMSIPSDSNCLTANSKYGDNRITAAIQQDNVYGVQFHPEKSGQSGLKLLSAFLQL